MQQHPALNKTGAFGEKLRDEAASGARLCDAHGVGQRSAEESESNGIVSKAERTAQRGASVESWCDTSVGKVIESDSIYSHI